MIDALYVAATTGFFALMLLYVRRCDALGAGDDAGDRARGAVDA